MKKFMSALVLAALATSLVACRKPEEKKPEAKVEAPKVVEETAKTASTASTASMAPGTASTASTAAPAATAPATK